MIRTKNHFLSREEEEELEHSNKKVKNVRHAGFSTGPVAGSSSSRVVESPKVAEASFKDKLLGEIPRAYNHAFAFDENMDTDIDFDEEIKELREGFAAVKFSKDVKHRIRVAWASSFIVKVYGRAVGFNYIQTKLNALWKPIGRLDIIDLGKDFFSCNLVVRRIMIWFLGEVRGSSGIIFSRYGLGSPTLSH